MTPQQRKTRERFESVIGFAAPVLNVVLAAGERLSRLVEPEDNDYYPPRASRVEPPAPAPQRLEAEHPSGHRQPEG